MMLLRRLWPSMESVTFFLSDCSTSWICRLLVADTLLYSCFRLSLFFQSSSPLFFNSASLGEKHAKQNKSAPSSSNLAELLSKLILKIPTVVWKSQLKSDCWEKDAPPPWQWRNGFDVSCCWVERTGNERNHPQGKMSSSDPFRSLAGMTLGYENRVVPGRNYHTNGFKNTNI